MSWLVKMAMAVAVALVPGAFVLLLAYITTRTVCERWHQAQAEAQLSGEPASLWHVVATLHFKDLVQQARAAL